MNGRQVVLVLFVALAVIQLAVSASVVVQRERSLRQGEVYRFRCGPVDPVDALRGRYVALAFEQNEVRTVESFRPGQKAFAGLEVGADGFARLSGLTSERPKDRPYMRVTVQRSGEERAWVRLPFDRYYMEESAAPEAERAYRDRSDLDSADAWVNVRVRAGHAVLEELYLGGLPVREYLESVSESEPSPR